ncbi:MAG: ribonuclease P protein component [Pseudomonadota bacterium]
MRGAPRDGRSFPPDPLERLKKRADFKRAAKGKRSGKAGFTLQAIARETGGPRMGFTVTKRIGNAVERNRIKRRLRAACAQLSERNPFQCGTDYVIVARRRALDQPFGGLVLDLEDAAGELRKKLQRRTDEGA